MNKYLKCLGSIFLCVIMVLSVLSFPANAAIGQTDYVVDDNAKVSLPKCYVPEEKIERVYLGSYLNNPKNMYVDDNDNLYVADSGNNRIIKFNSKMEFVKEYSAQKTLNNPSGAYFDDEKSELYIADTGNERIVVVDSKDNFIREYHKPESQLLEDTMQFDPTNISLGIQGHIYMLKGQNFMQVSQEGEFKGFVGSTKVAASLITALTRRFGSEKQKKMLVTEQPNPYLNFTMDKNGLIYAITDTSTSQIRKINMVGDNLYPEKFYGEMVIQDGWRVVNPHFISIAVSSDGIISVLEEKGKKIYQYSQNGTMLNVFGGEGEVEGFFQSPTSIAVDSKGSIYVADSGNNIIQRFSRTTFVSAIYDAQIAYDQGFYEEAYDLYSKAKMLNPNYSILNDGIADCLYKMGKLDEAAQAYKAANNRDGYGKVMAVKRKSVMKEYFGWICLIVLISITTIIILGYKLRKYATLIVSRFYHLDN